MELTAENLVEYLHQRHLTDQTPVITPLASSPQSRIFRVVTPERSLVIKQMKTPPPDETARRDPREAFETEVSTLRFIGNSLGGGQVAEILDEDETLLTYAMTDFPTQTANWSHELESGHYSPGTASSVSKLLQDIQGISIHNPDLPMCLWDSKHFQEEHLTLRFDKMIYAHPELTDPLKELKTELMAMQESLVHGRFNTENILVSGESIFLVDFGMAHVGHHAFDLASMMCSLLLHFVHQPTQCDEMRDIIGAFVEPFGEPAPTVLPCLGSLLIASADSRHCHPVLSDAQREIVRQAGVWILQKEILHFVHLVDNLEELVKQG